MEQAAHKLPKVSFLTVNFNQAGVTLELLASLEKLTYPNWECVVVDNGSKPSSLGKDVGPHPKVKFIHSKENLGFAGGNNLGLPHCKGEYVFLINNDTEVPAGFLEPIIEFVNNKPQLGALSPRIVYHNRNEIIQYAGATPLNTLTLRNSTIGQGEQDKGQYQEAKLTPYAHGAAMLIPRKVIDEVGTMYNDYFLYYEEYDWCERIKSAGWEIWYFGASKIYHKESVSTGINSPLKIYYLTRNRLLFARRNLASVTVALNYIYFSLIALPKNILMFVLRGHWRQAKAFWQGYFYNISHSSKPARQ